MEYAKSLIKRRPGEKVEDDEQEDIEENWTFIGDENEDSDVLSRAKSLDGKDKMYGPGLDEIAIGDLERRIEKEIEKAGPMPREREREREVRKDVKGQAKVW